MKRFKSAALVACCVAAAAAVSVIGVSAKDGNWPQFRGPEGQGVSPESGAPLEWGATKNVLWKAEVPGQGHSSPIIWGKRLFLTTAVEGEEVPGAKPPVHKIEGQEWKHPDSVGANKRHAFKVLCYDRDTGKLLWERTAFEGTPYDDRHRKSSFAAPTPATDGKLVYAYFGSEGLYAYDFSGKLAWKQSLGKIGTLGMGVGTSPVLYENTVIVLADNETGQDSALVAFDKKTGKEVWRTKRTTSVTWATPLVVRTRKRAELITAGNEAVISYDAATGKELWRARGLEANAIPSPLTDGELAFVYAGYPKKSAMAVRLGGSGEMKEKTDIIWTFDRGTAYVPSGIYYRGLVYLMTDKGLLTALDAKTGEVKYQGGRVPVPATFMASPVAFGDVILLTSEDGDTYVIKAGPKHEVLRTNSLGEPIYASPAIADDKIFIRAAKHLYAIGAKS
jgi:outer membrane protein assembly factor BamB